jgi:hypothetical protein
MCDIFDQEICFKTCYSTANLKQFKDCPISPDKQCRMKLANLFFLKHFVIHHYYVLKVHFLTSEMTYYPPYNAT